MIDYKKSVVPLDHITTDTKVYQLKDKKGRKDTQALREETHAEFGNYTSYILIEDTTVDKIGKYAKTGENSYTLITEDNVDRYHDQLVYDKVAPSGVKGRLEAAENATAELDNRLNNKINAVKENLDNKIDDLDEKVERIHREQVVLAENGLPKITDVNLVLGNIYLVPASLPIEKGGKAAPTSISTYIEWVFSKTKGIWEEVGNTEAYLKHSDRALKGDISYDTRAIKWSEEDNDINVNLMLSPLEVLIPSEPSTARIDGNSDSFFSNTSLHNVMPDIESADDHDVIGQ